MTVPAHAGPADSLGPRMRLRLAGFVRSLRDNGFAIGLAETRDAIRILASPAAGRPATLRPALRALLCATRSDWERFDVIFDAYWLGRGMRSAQRASAPSAESGP
ncbi:MAG: vWA domain-containing protein, partial [Geminicoccales bacterium]